MTDPLLDVRRLAVLRSVAEHGSLSAAAFALRYAPSAVSQQMTQLEQQLGVRLLERHARGARLTEAGAVLLRHADAALAHLDDARRELAALAGAERGSVRLAAFGSAWAELVPRAVAAHRAARPEVALVLEEADPRTALARLHAGRLDLAVVFEPNDADPVHAGSLATELLAEDPLRAVLPADHPLAAADAVALDALAGEPWALATDACAAQVRAACEAAGFVPREVFASADYAALQGFVATGSAVALVPALACRPARPGVAVRPLAGAGPRRRLLAAGPAGGHRSPAAGAVVAALRAAAQALLTEPAAPAADVSPARAAPPPPPTRRSRRAAP